MYGLMNQKEEIKEIPYIQYGRNRLEEKRNGLPESKIREKEIRRKFLGEDYAIQDNKKRKFLSDNLHRIYDRIAPVTDCV